MKLLLIEDDETVIAELRHNLRIHHAVVDAVSEAEAGWTYATTYDYDLIALNILLPGMDGIGFCHKLREEGCTTPILLLTPPGSPFDKVRGLDAGADDYVVKPFDIDELSARIRALLRRGKANPFPLLAWEDLTLNPSTFEVTYEGKPLVLTIKEYELLELFLRDCRHVFSSDEILDKLWSAEEFPVESTVRSHVRRLRNKLVAAGAPQDFISTIYGRGYYLKPVSFTTETDKPGDPSSSLPHDKAQLPTPSTKTDSICWLIAPDALSTQPLLDTLKQSEFHPAVALSLEIAHQELLIPSTLDKTKQPDIIIFQLPTTSSAVVSETSLESCWEFLKNLTHTHPGSLILVVGQLLNWKDRLTLQHLGKQVLLASSINPESILHTAHHLLNWRQRTAKVLVVDSDLVWLQNLPSQLSSWGFTVSTLTEPKQFWNILESFKPDALLLDNNIAAVDGLQLCQLLKRDLRWQQLPILCLSTIDNPNVQLNALAMGADDYLLKPVPEKELAHRLRSQLYRKGPRII
jgi:DNA-binding response OmpR family regulator